ncbi:hypothetical protein TWF173_006603 [Orbilia oligospora]|nr:hypothetical protein TWF173_006603 [Orbilia oligospora]
MGPPAPQNGTHGYLSKIVVGSYNCKPERNPSASDSRLRNVLEEQLDTHMDELKRNVQEMFVPLGTGQNCQEATTAYTMVPRDEDEDVDAETSQTTSHRSHNNAATNAELIINRPPPQTDSDNQNATQPANEHQSWFLRIVGLVWGSPVGQLCWRSLRGMASFTERLLGGGIKEIPDKSDHQRCGLKLHCTVETANLEPAMGEGITNWLFRMIRLSDTPKHKEYEKHRVGLTNKEAQLWGKLRELKELWSSAEKLMNSKIEAQSNNRGRMMSIKKVYKRWESQVASRTEMLRFALFNEPSDAGEETFERENTQYTKVVCARKVGWVCVDLYCLFVEDSPGLGEEEEQSADEDFPGLGEEEEQSADEDSPGLGEEEEHPLAKKLGTLLTELEKAGLQNSDELIKKVNDVCALLRQADSNRADVALKAKEALYQVFISVRSWGFGPPKSPEEFKKLNDSLLKEFFYDLISEAPGVSRHSQIIRLLRRRSQREQVTGWIRTLCLQRSDSKELPLAREFEEQGYFRSGTQNRFIQSQDSTRQSVPAPITNDNERNGETDTSLDGAGSKDNESGDEGEGEMTPGVLLEDIESMKDIFTTGKPFQSLKSNLYSHLHPPQNIQDALKVGNIKLLKRLLNGRFEEAAIGEYSWIKELADGGYSIDAIAEVLMQDATDTPWIYFEPREFDPLKTGPKDGAHTPLCVHQCFGPGELADENKLPGTSDCLDIETNINEIQELCGLAGITPSSRDPETWNGTVSFKEENSVAVVSYSGYEIGGSSAILKKVINILVRLCHAAARMQSSGLCCDAFTVLVHPIQELDTEAGILPINICRIEFSLIVKFLVGLQVSSDLGSILEPKLTEIRECILWFLESIGQNLPEIIPHKSPEEILNLLCLTTQLLSIGLLSYNQGHAGPMRPFFLDTPQKKIILAGIKPHENQSQCIKLGLNKLTCVGDMIGSPVLAFRVHSSITDALSAEEGGRFDIFTTAEDLLDTWGPGDLITQNSQRNSVCGIQISGGIISLFGDSSNFHWSNTLGIGGIKPGNSFNPRTRIRIGSPVEVNERCTIDENQCWENSSRAFENLEVHRHYWEHDETQFGAQAGQYVVLQANRTKRKIPGKTWKQEILEQEPKMLVPYLSCLCGLQVSFCTGVARRVTLGQLIADIFPVFVGMWFMKDCLRNDLSKIIDALHKNTLQSALETLPEDLRDKTLYTIQKIVFCLRSTGIDSEREFLSVAWINPENKGPIQCLRIPCDVKTNSWVHVLADSEDCATFACISTDCLVTKEIHCRGSSPLWHNTTPLLETAVFQCNGSPSHPLQPLDNKKTYFFQKMDFLLKVTVSKQIGSTNVALLVTQSSVPARFTRRLGSWVLIGGNPWIRIREKQKPFESAVELVTVLAENKTFMDTFLPAVPLIPLPTVTITTVPP